MARFVGRYGNKLLSCLGSVAYHLAAREASFSQKIKVVFFLESQKSPRLTSLTSPLQGKRQKKMVIGRELECHKKLRVEIFHKKVEAKDKKRSLVPVFRAQKKGNRANSFLRQNCTV